jgi:hypothetical protein
VSDIKKLLADIERDSIQSAARSASESLGASLAKSSTKSTIAKALEFSRFSSSIEAAVAASKAQSSSWANSLESASRWREDLQRAAIGPMEDFKRLVDSGAIRDWSTELAKLADSTRAFTLQFRMPDISEFRGLAGDV